MYKEGIDSKNKIFTGFGTESGILLIEGMRCYYDKLLATAKNSEEVSTPKEVSPEKVKAA